MLFVATFAHELLNIRHAIGDLDPVAKKDQTGMQSEAL